MLILQIADLHISQNIDENNKLDELYRSILKNYTENEKIIILICGDIIDCGDELNGVCVDEKIKCASKFLDSLKEKFRKFDFDIEFVPGNHDIHKKSFEKFNDLISKYNNKKYSFTEDETGIIRKYDDFDILLMNSSFHFDRKFGKVDLKCLDKLDKDKPSIIALHHTFLSENDNDNSAIRNSYKFFEKIEEKNIIALLHGHTHGYKDIKIGKNCLVVGVGPFIKNVENVNNQFNLIEIDEQSIRKISNCCYHADRNIFNSDVVYSEERNNFFSGNSVEKVYKKVVKETKRNKCIYNIGINIKMKYDIFKNEIKSCFGEENIKKAKDWQEYDVPESLYYNHGQYMKIDNIKGVDYIIEELESKATSSRAIIPLINFADVIKSEDSFLPSFDIVQCTFEDDSKTKIFITIYLRALEVNHFLKINLCETYLMINKIKEKIRQIDCVDVNIFACKAQYKEKYGCFKRAKLDSLKESDLTMKLVDKKYGDIIEMLEEKVDLNETVIESKGLYSLCNVIETMIKRGEENVYDEILKAIKSVLLKLNELKKEREKTSNYDEINSVENKLNKEIYSLIKLFKNEINLD